MKYNHMDIQIQGNNGPTIIGIILNIITWVFAVIGLMTDHWLRTTALVLAVLSSLSTIVVNYQSYKERRRKRRTIRK